MHIARSFTKQPQKHSKHGPTHSKHCPTYTNVWQGGSCRARLSRGLVGGSCSAGLSDDSPGGSCGAGLPYKTKAKGGFPTSPRVVFRRLPPFTQDFTNRQPSTEVCGAPGPGANNKQP